MIFIIDIIVYLFIVPIISDCLQLLKFLSFLVKIIRKNEIILK